ncbi:hypothetical protein LUZ60_002367 [Juncus effusus]|nr:hypothetical protein LUZ60_002367 [Juncus effusus]
MHPPKRSPGEEGGGSAEADAKKKMKRDCTVLEPRSYQLAIFEVAVKRNTIAVLDTGAGKTMISVMLIKHICDQINGSDRITDAKRLVVFLCPTVVLVHQQYEEIKSQTSVEVEKYYGLKGVDTWTAENWKKEISQNQVMVMTPQILLDALRKAFITLEPIRLMILDECHNATGNHPYTRIMKEFYHSTIRKPSIFGMTASPVIRKGVASSLDCEDQLKELESLLDAKICTLTDRSELDYFVPCVKQVNRYYDCNDIRFEGLREKLLQILTEYDCEIEKLQKGNEVQYKDASEIIKDSRKSISAYLNRILVCLDDCGLICARQAVKFSLESNHIPQENDSAVLSAANALCNKFLQAVLVGIVENLTDGYEELLNSESGCKRALDLGYFSPKVYELIQILYSFGIRCLVFVERIITAKALERLTSSIKCLSHFRFSYLTGGASSSVDALSLKVQKETLESFRSGKVNILFTTDVAEEGLNVPDCSCVIRFDLPKTVRSYVQSSGRVRQENSNFIIMLERGNVQQRDLLFDILRSKYSMIDTAMKRDNTSPVCAHLSTDFDAREEYSVESTGAKVTAASSISLVHLYCTKLPKDKFYNPKPNLIIDQLSNNLFACKLLLPTNAAFQTLVGPAETSSQKARQSVCLEACKKLHEMGGLDDYLRPCADVADLEGLDEVDKEIGKKSTAGEGTNKRKELHGTATIKALSGTWAHNKNGVKLQAYRFDFVCNLLEIKYSSFVLLIDTVLDEDVGSLDLDLYLVEKMVKAKVSPAGVVQLDQEQVKKAKIFQELFFNGLFGRVIIGRKPAKKFLLNENTDSSLWSPSKMYFLLPINASCTKSVEIYWRGINSTISAVQFLRNVYSAPDPDFSTVGETRDEGEICLANETVKIEDLKECLVMAVHTGKIYLILEVLNDLSAENKFDGVSEKSDCEFQTFNQYFKKKYNISLKHPNQPMLLLKHSHNAHNLLTKHSIEAESASSETKKHKKCAPTKKPEAHAHMPPELLVRIDVSTDIYKSFYLIPSVMHRIESLMLASQLRENVGYNTHRVPTFLILEALTTLRAAEDFSFERLELLGDSVLKYTVSCHLFLKYLDKHEGQLTSRRCQLICNATLHRLGIKQNIQTYIRDEAFEPRRWLAPGQITIHPSPCDCLIDNDADSAYLDKYIIDDVKNSLIIGKTCDKGHRWMCSKTVSDCVEALIGAYYIGGGLDGSIALLKWLGLDVSITEDLICEAIKAASLWDYSLKVNEIKTVEEKIGYKFGAKGLLLEALTHQSQQELGISYCYQRLEFLGDAVLDILITRHLYNTHTDIDPGELTDLRSASVNNETFAQCAVKHNLYKHLQHGSQFLLEQINDYINGFRESSNGSDPSKPPPKGPKVLGDIVESIAGALLIDTKFNLIKTWEIFQKLLSPLVTPENLELQPWRELSELCCHHGYFLELTCEKTKKGDMVNAAVQVQLEDVRIVRSAVDRVKKEAKGKAASLLLKDLEKKGLLHSRYGSHMKQVDEVSNGEKLCEYSGISNMDLDEMVLPDSDNGVPVSINVSVKKGGPRSALFKLCKTKQWPMPTFDFTEVKQSNGGKGAPSQFIATINLRIPFLGAIKLNGEGKLDKKSSQDSAAMLMLYELQKQHRCEIHEML